MVHEWYFQVMGQDLGPLTAAELKQKAASGQVQQDTLVRRGRDGKWTYAGTVKGLFPEPPPAPTPPAKPAIVESLPASHVTKHLSKISTAPVFVPLNKDDEAESDPPSTEFYNFVGFREAVSPILHDAVKQFATNRGLTISQLNRRALAAFIERPELACDLIVSAIATVQQPVCIKSNQTAGKKLSEHDRNETSTFRFTLFNSGTDPIQLTEGAFVADCVDELFFESISNEPHSSIDHTGHLAVRIEQAKSGRAVRFPCQITIPPSKTREVTIWFCNKGPTASESHVKVTKYRGQLLIGHGDELAMSEFFHVTIHCDSPKANAAEI